MIGFNGGNGRKSGGNEMLRRGSPHVLPWQFIVTGALPSARNMRMDVSTCLPVQSLRGFQSAGGRKGRLRSPPPSEMAIAEQPS